MNAMKKSIECGIEPQKAY